ncbi:MAG: hypothetical protein ACR2NR_08455 [Solirubrobacteraceae bacterium]
MDTHNLHADEAYNSITSGVAWGEHGAQMGVGGASDTNYGVYARSDQNVGLFAQGAKGAAEFQGSVNVSGDLHHTGGLFTTGDIAHTGNLHTTGNLVVDGDISLSGADYAEAFDVVHTNGADPGTVMVLDDCGGVRVSDSAYDRRVAGVVSGAGGYGPAVVLDRRSTETDRRPLALMGKVYCRVDAGDAPVAIGDLLTTSSTPGHAMKASDSTQAFGAVIGKALQGLPAGRGLLPILVALQ